MCSFVQAVLDQKKKLVQLIFNTISHARKMAVVASHLDNPEQMVAKIRQTREQHLSLNDYESRLHHFEEFLHDVVNTLVVYL